jgi:tetratricopeptide (TPR) repeat protein
MAADLASSFLDRYRLAAVIQAIEEDLRSFIRRYVAPYLEPSDLFGDALPELFRRAERDGVVDAPAAVLVDYIDFGDAFAMLNRRRGMIPDDLGAFVRSATPGFELAVPIRNRIMHGRPLLRHDEEHVAKLGQSISESNVDFPLTRGVARRIVDEPDWVPLVEISSKDYGNVLHNLPLPEFDETGLLGRDDELRELKRLLERPRFPVVTIAGEGGIGKTALAVQALYDLVDESDGPYEAVLWVSLKTERLTGRGVEQLRSTAFDFLTLTSDLAEALGAEGADDISLLADVLAGTRTLIAIDNIESISPVEIRRLVNELPDCQFLLTSRVGLGEMEIRLPLAALGVKSAEIMLRQLSARRDLPQLARVTEAQAAKITEQLRRSPLAIRWFVEAVQVGGQPDDLLRDQSAVLQFCMSTIYDSLEPDAHRIVACLLELDRPATVGEIALLTDLTRDEVQTHVYEIQRRSLVVVDSKLTETLAQSYALADMAREHLRRFGSPDTLFTETVRERLRKIAHVDSVMKAFDNRLALEPAAVIAETDEELAVAQLLRRALSRSRVGDIDGARELIQRARDAVPGYFESYRVAAFIESDLRPQEAFRLYEEAYRLAPDDLKPRVGYWLAGHLAKNSAATEEAAAYAEEAHRALEQPGTALRLARIRMYQHRFEEADDLLRYAASDGKGKTVLIAETDLLDLAKRRAEHRGLDEHQPLQALQLTAEALRRAEGCLGEGINDLRFNNNFVELIGEALQIALKADDFAPVAEALSPILEVLDRHIRIAATPQRRTLWERRLEWIAAREETSEDVAAYASKILSRLARQVEQSAAGVETGEIVSYAPKSRYGFIKAGGGESHFFHRSDLADPQDAIYLARGLEATCRIKPIVRDGKPGTRATDVSPLLTPIQRERLLRHRRALVVTRNESFLFAEDLLTQERIFVHRSAFRDSSDWRQAVVGRRLVLDVEFARRGPCAARGSVFLDQGDGER